MTIRRTTARLALVAVALGPVLLEAQPARTAESRYPVVARDADARMHRVAPDVYAIIHDDATTAWPSGTTEWPHGNTGVIVGPDGVLVINDAYLPTRASADIALIREVTRQPVRYLVNTHWHGDHTHGNGVYRDSFPAMVLLGQEANREWIRTNLDRYPAIVAAGAGVARRRHPPPAARDR